MTGLDNHRDEAYAAGKTVRERKQLNEVGMRYKRTFQLLQRCGHSGTKALEIVIDAKRDATKRWAVDWIRLCRRSDRHRLYMRRQARG